MKIGIRKLKIERERERVPSEEKSFEDVWLPHARVSRTRWFKEMNQCRCLL